MTNKNLFVFLVEYVKRFGGKGRGVVIVRKTSLDEITKEFEEFLSLPENNNIDHFIKKVHTEEPKMVMYEGRGEENIIFGLSEVGWKGDYGLTNTDLVVSIH